MNDPSTALDEFYRMVKDSAMPSPPGLKPKPWKAQWVEFVRDLPDLMRRGPRWQEIEQKHGAGQAQAYMDSMMTEIKRGRQRRRRAP